MLNKSRKVPYDLERNEQKGKILGETDDRRSLNWT